MKSRPSVEVQRTGARVKFKVAVPEVSAEEHALAMKAREVIEIARCARKAEAEGLVVDALRELVGPCGPAKLRSGFMSKYAKGTQSECAHCGEVRRLFMRPSRVLWCADCVLDDIIATSNITLTVK